MKVALVHDWLVGQRGGEQVLLQLARLFPTAPIYTLVHAPGSVHPELEAHPIHTSWVQRAPGAPQRFRYLLPALWQAMGQFDLSAYDLVLSTSHCVAVGVPTHAQQVHVAYVHSPMRYLYDQMHHYLPRRGRRLATPWLRLATSPLRWRDHKAGQGPQVILANSAYVAQRIAQAWGRKAAVVHPPVDVAYFATANAPAAAARHGFVAVNALVPYKRTEALVRWASLRQQPLTVVGKGSEAARLRALAGPTVKFAPFLPRPALRALLQQAEALLFAGEEDFGISPVEALAAGCPVVACHTGGVQESMVSPNYGPLGVLFANDSPAALDAAVATLRQRQAQGVVTAQRCQAHAQRFAPSAFAHAYLREVAGALPPSAAQAWAKLAAGPA